MKPEVSCWEWPRLGKTWRAIASNRTENFTASNQAVIGERPCGAARKSAKGGAMNLKTFATGVLIASALSGCVSTQEMSLAPNVVRIDTNARGLLFTSQTVPTTMRMAAKATLDRGYTHFRVQDASLAQGSVVTGAVGSGNTNVSGTYGGGFVNANANSFGSTTVVRAPTASAAVTVVMFRASEPGAQGAFDADQVMKQYSQ